MGGGGGIKMTLEIRRENFLKRLEKERPGEYTLLGEYVKMRSKTEFRHEDCGYEWETNPFSLVGKGGIASCPHCANRAKSKTNEEIRRELKELEGGPFDMVEGEEYVNQYTPIKVIHEVCGHVFKATPQTLITNRSCPKCFERNKGWQGKTLEEFKEDLKSERGEEYKVAKGGKYRGANEKIEIEHAECGHIWEVRAAHILYRSGCPRCNKSKGEELIAKILQANNLGYKPQKTFPDCKNIKELPFDFAVKSSKGEIYCLIEYDGEQHFTPFKHFGGIKKFEKLKNNDRIKDEYCRENDITLIRIPYTKTEKEIEELINTISQEVT